MAGKARRPESSTIRRLPVTALLIGLMAPLSGNANAQQAENSDRMDTLSARGLLNTPMRVELRTLLEAPVASLPLKPGDRFDKDALLVGFDCSRYVAQEQAAKAGANAAWIEHRSKKRLLRHGAIGKDEVSLAAARASKATAELRIHEVTNADCQISAPFAGRVASVNAKPFEHPERGTPLITIIDDSSLEVELIVPSIWLSWLKPGAAFDFKVEETGAVVRGSIARLSPEIDPVSQTIRIFGMLETLSNDGLLPGMSGVARFDGNTSG